MLTRKTQYGWMALGGLICLFGLVLACKLRDGSKAVAQAESPMVSPTYTPDKDKPASPAPKSESKGKAAVNDDRPMLEPVIPATFQPNTPSERKAPPSPKKDPGKPQSIPNPTPPLSPLMISGDPFIGGASKPSAPPPPLPPTRSAKTSLPPDAPPKTPPPPPSKTPPPPPPTKTPPPITWDRPLSDSAVSPIGIGPYSVEVDPIHEIKPQPGEPPLAPAPGPVQVYRVNNSETLQDIARRTLGSIERCSDLHRLNPTIKPDSTLPPGTVVRLPADACVQNDAEPVQRLPLPRVKPTPPKAKAMPLTGTYQCSLDDKGGLTLPRAIRDQLGGSSTVMVSPGTDDCLWLTTSPHLERLSERLEQSHISAADVRVFKRLYFAQTEKLTINGDGRISIPERMVQFAGLHQELVLIGIDDHFEVWDAARWRQYTQQKSGVGRSTAFAEQE